MCSKVTYITLTHISLVKAIHSYLSSTGNHIISFWRGQCGWRGWGGTKVYNQVWHQQNRDIIFCKETKLIIMNNTAIIACLLLSCLLNVFHEMHPTLLWVYIFFPLYCHFYSFKNVFNLLSVTKIPPITLKGNF